MRALLASCKTAPHNSYQPHPAEPEQHTKCSNRAFVLLKMWGAVLQDASTASIMQDSAPQPLPTTSSRTRTTHQMQGHHTIVGANIATCRVVQNYCSTCSACWWPNLAQICSTDIPCPSLEPQYRRTVSFATVHCLTAFTNV